jgi:hypothetical protein
LFALHSGAREGDLMGGKPKTWRPRDAHNYCRKSDALGFIDELRAMVEEGHSGSMFKIRVEFNVWRPAIGEKPWKGDPE